MDQPLLSICIPIYNRSVFLNRMLQRFLQEKELFCNSIELFVSDNCSTEDLESICFNYERQGLKVNYKKNTSNLGMDGNFINCFRYANGKYVWLLGSDDIPSNEALVRILDVLSKNEIGLLYLDRLSSNDGIEEYHFFADLLFRMNSYITFISGMIVNREVIRTTDFDKYRGTLISQVPLYLNAMYAYKKNLVYNFDYLQGDDDSKSNSGYNLFNVFVVNLLKIIHDQVDLGRLTESEYLTFKRLHFKYFLAGDVGRRLIFKTNGNLDTSSAWKILKKYYGRCPYAYWYVVNELCKSLLRKLQIIK